MQHVTWALRIQMCLVGKLKTKIKRIILRLLVFVDVDNVKDCKYPVCLKWSLLAPPLAAASASNQLLGFEPASLSGRGSAGEHDNVP